MPMDIQVGDILTMCSIIIAMIRHREAKSNSEKV